MGHCLPILKFYSGLVKQNATKDSNNSVKQIQILKLAGSPRVIKSFLKVEVVNYGGDIKKR